MIALAACGFPDITDEVVQRGRLLEVHHEAALPVCTEAIDNADRFVEATAELLGEPARTTPYYLYRDIVEQCRVFGEETADCEADGTVYSARWVLWHELVHAAAQDLGAPPALLLEGLAEALGRPYPILNAEQRQTAHVELDTVAFFSHGPFDNYATAGDFVGYLLDRYGAARFRQLYGRLLYLSDALTTWREVERVYGRSFDDLIADWRRAEPGSPQFPLRRLRCEARSILPSAPDSWDETESFDCPSWNATSVQAVMRSIDVASAGVYVGDFELTDPSGRVAMTATLDTCDDNETALTYARFANGGTHVLVTALAPGRHSLAFQSSFGDAQPATLRWNVARTPGDGARCETTSVFTPPEPRWSMLVLGEAAHWLGRVDGRPDVADVWVEVAGSAATSINAQLYAGESAQLCNGDCTQPTNCVDVQRAPTRWTPNPNEPIFLHVIAPVDQRVLVTVGGSV
jgi:hypothetical protein